MNIKEYYVAIALAVIVACSIMSIPAPIEEIEELEDVGSRSIAGMSRTSTNSSNATTTLESLQTGDATSTLELSITRGINADINVYAVASSSASVFQIEPFISFDNDNDLREWYTLTDYASANNKRIAFDSDITSTTRTHINLGTLRANKLKVDYKVEGDDADIYIEVIQEKD